MSLLPLALSFMGCLVTEEVEFVPETQCPPAIYSAPDAANPLNRLISVNLDNFSEQERMSGTLQFDVIVRDCNVDDPLEWQVWTDRDPRFGNTNFFGGTLSPTPSLSEERDFSFEINLSDLALEQSGVGECHKFELFVTSDFSAQPPNPQEIGDVDVAAWWVSVFDDNTPDQNISRLGDCP